MSKKNEVDPEIQAFDLNVKDLIVFADGDALYVSPKDRSCTIVIKADQKKIVDDEETPYGSRLILTKTKYNDQLAPEDEPETEENCDRYDTYEIAGMVVGCWDDHTMVICNEDEPKCSLLIANSPTGPILTTTAGAAIPMPDDDIEISLSAD